MRLAVTALVLAALAACAPTAEAPGPEGLPFSAGPYGPDGPPQIGTITGTAGDSIAAWAVYDYSVGAIDPSAFVVRDDAGLRLTVIGYPVGEPFTEEGLLRIEGALPDLTAPVDVPVTITNRSGLDWDGNRLEGPATLRLTRIDPPPEGEVLGRIAGTTEVQLCPLGPSIAAGPCLLFEMQLTTRAAFPGP